MSKKQPKQTRPKKSRAGVGGPKTPEGKHATRFNAMKHGLRPGQLVLLLPDETEEEYEALRAGWLREYQPESFSEKTLCEELIRAHWLFERAQRRLMEAERAIAGDENVHPVDWPEEDEHKIELLRRYKTSHERSFYRAWNAWKQLKKDDLNKAVKRSKMTDGQEKTIRELDSAGGSGDDAGGSCDDVGMTGAGLAGGDGKSRAEALFRGQQAKKKRKKLVTLEQWVEIETEPESGAFTTTLYPSNEDLIARGQRLWPAPTLVVRRLNFVGGVPREYEWAFEGYAGDVELLRKLGGCGLQRIEVNDWLEHAELEAREGNGHLLPISNLPRPQERGGCECAVCVENERRLEVG